MDQVFIGIIFFVSLSLKDGNLKRKLTTGPSIHSLIGRRVVGNGWAIRIPVAGSRGALVEARIGGTLLGGLVGGCGNG